MKNILSLFLLLALAGCTAKADEQKKEKQNLLFIIHATKGHYANGTLTLMQTNSAVAYFSDRPQRHAGMVALPKVLEAWSSNLPDSWEKSPPNAGLVFFEDHNDQYSEIPIELKAPKYNQDQGVLTFQVRPLTEKQIPDNKQLNEVILFIDDCNCVFTFHRCCF